MWKYTHTDEMYHSLTSRNNSTELYHSDVYLGQDFSDGIRHWKYIKREKVNGRWKYYYSHTEYNAAKKANQKAQTNHAKASAAARKAKATYEEKDAALGNANMRYQISKIPAALEKNPIKRLKAKKQNKKYFTEYKKANEEYDNAYWDKRVAEGKAKNAGEEAAKKQKEYNKIAKKTKVRRAVGEATVKVANKASDASYNTKKKVKAVKKKVNKSVDKGKKAVNKIWDKIYTSQEESKAGTKHHITGVATTKTTTTEKKKKKKR